MVVGGEACAFMRLLLPRLRAARAPSPRSCGERVWVRGASTSARVADIPPHPNPLPLKKGDRERWRSPPPPPSIYILLIAPFALELADERHRLVGGAHAVLRDDVDQRALDVLGHPLRVTADVHMRAVG